MTIRFAEGGAEPETEFDRMALANSNGDGDGFAEFAGWLNAMTAGQDAVGHARRILSSPLGNYNLKMNVLRFLGLGGHEFVIDFAGNSYSSGQIVRAREAWGLGEINLGLSVEKTRSATPPPNRLIRQAEIRVFSDIFLLFENGRDLVIGDSTSIGILASQLGFPLADADLGRMVSVKKNKALTVRLPRATWCGWETTYAHFLIDVAAKFPRAGNAQDILAANPSAFQRAWAAKLGCGLQDVGAADGIEIEECVLVPEIDLSSSVQLLRDRVLGDPIRQTRRIFIRRPNNSRLANQDEICANLQAQGFDIVDFAPMSIDEQIRTVQESYLIVAASGAELANTVFCHKNTIIVDLIGRHLARSDWHMFDIYQRIARIIGSEYHMIECDAELTPGVSMQNNPWHCPVDRLNRTLDLILGARLAKTGDGVQE